MVGYELIHSPSFIILLIAGVFTALCCLTITLLEYFYSDWYLDLVKPTPTPGYSYGKANTKWGLSTDPYYDKEDTVVAQGVPVLYYKQTTEGWKSVLTNTMGCPKTVNWHGNNFTWAWISEVKRSGWRQDNPPADPTIIASTGMWAHIDRILSEEQGVETGGENSKLALTKATTTTNSHITT